MIRTQYGTFDGNSWEELCQKCFKLKYGDEGYQEMIASPGDFGIEGFTINTGKSFQCYCPNKEYSKPELNERIRDKITKDLNKLKNYESDLKDRLGDAKISTWYFVTPIVDSNKILIHATKKAKEVMSWGLDIIAEDFSIEIRDADFYSSEIGKIKVIHGEKILVGNFDVIAEIDWSTMNDEYVKNVNRKNTKRISDHRLNEQTISKLNSITFQHLTSGDELLNSISKDHPELYELIVRVISQYENEVEELSITWCGTANELIDKVKIDLEARINTEVNSLSNPDVKLLVNHVTSRWLALCPLDIT